MWPQLEIIKCIGIFLGNRRPTFVGTSVWSCRKPNLNLCLSFEDYILEVIEWVQLKSTLFPSAFPSSEYQRNRHYCHLNEIKEQKSPHNVLIARQYSNRKAETFTLPPLPNIRPVPYQKEMWACTVAHTVCTLRTMSYMHPTPIIVWYQFPQCMHVTTLGWMIFEHYLICSSLHLENKIKPKQRKWDIVQIKEQTPMALFLVTVSVGILALRSNHLHASKHIDQRRNCAAWKHRKSRPLSAVIKYLSDSEFQCVVRMCRTTYHFSETVVYSETVSCSW